MATSSFEFDKLFQQRIDKNYNSYNSPIQRQRLYKEAVYNAFEKVYRQFDTQEEYDELRSFVKTNFPITPINNAIDLNTVLADYNHYLYARGIFLLPTNPNQQFVSLNYDGLKTVAVSNRFLPYRTGDKVRFSDVNIMTDIIGDRFLKRIGLKTYQIFNDEALTVPFLASSSNVYKSNAGVVKQIIESSFIVQYSDQRIQKLDTPSIRNPKLMISSNRLELYPNGCETIFLDYLTKPPIFITQTANVFDQTNDLELTYPMKFIYQIIDSAYEIFNLNTKDTESFREGINYQNINQ